MNAFKFYEENIENSKRSIKELNKKVLAVGWSRLVIIILLIISVYKTYEMNNMFLVGVSFVVLLGIFIIVAAFHSKLFRKKRMFELKIEINEKGLRRLNGEFKNEKDKGVEFMDEKHPYTSDLDIFGNNSLFQLINSTVTQIGREALAKILSRNTMTSREEICKKQEAIKELGGKAKWRQKFMLRGLLHVNNTEKEVNELEYLKEWSKSKEQNAGYKKLIAYIFILITFGAILLIVLGKMRGTYLIPLLMVNYVVIRLLTKEYSEDLKMFAKLKPTVKAYAKLLELIDEEEFESSYLNEVKNRLKNAEGSSSRNEMKKLASILDWAGDSHGNAFYLIINLFIFSNVFLVSNLESWKKKNKNHLEQWIEVIGEFDAYSSVSNLSFDFENFVYPEISEEKEVVGSKIGHPILGERAVKNTYELTNGKKATLITGSNMSGKSTFLRTIGLNLVLCYLGAPVNAEKFKCGLFDIYTCMRTKDNLEESISSFYAEILRIKILIEGAKSGKRIFFLLDEIFKGTNSKDRHIGATVLINQLMNSGAVGLVSTHDLELCDLEETDKRIENKNFREYYENDKIKFDYTLRDGKSKTQNAIHLMKLAGIDFEEK